MVITSDQQQQFLQDMYHNDSDGQEYQRLKWWQFTPGPGSQHHQFKQYKTRQDKTKQFIHNVSIWMKYRKKQMDDRTYEYSDSLLTGRKTSINDAKLTKEMTKNINEVLQ